MCYEQDFPTTHYHTGTNGYVVSQYGPSIPEGGFQTVEEKKEEEPYIPSDRYNGYGAQNEMSGYGASQPNNYKCRDWASPSDPSWHDNFAWNKPDWREYDNICDGTESDCVYKGKLKCWDDPSCYGIMFDRIYKGIVQF